MITLKVVMVQHLSGEVSYEVGKTYDFPTAEAIRLVDAEIAKPKNKKEYEAALSYIANEENEKLEKEKQIAAIQYRDELLDEKKKLQERIDAINDVLGIKESVVVEPSEENETQKSERNDENINDGEKTDLSQGEGN